MTRPHPLDKWAERQRPAASHLIDLVARRDAAGIQRLLGGRSPSEVGALAVVLADIAAAHEQQQAAHEKGHIA